VPKQHSSGGKDKLGSIGKQGDRYLRSLFTAGALAVIRYAKIQDSSPSIRNPFRGLYLRCPLCGSCFRSIRKSRVPQ
jgi:transposase